MQKNGWEQVWNSVGVFLLFGLLIWIISLAPVARFARWTKTKFSRLQGH